MTKTRLLFLPLCIVASLTGACESTVTAEGEPIDRAEAQEAYDQAQDALASCGLSDCGTWDLWSGATNAQTGCMVDALELRSGLHASLSNWADGGGACGTVTDVYVRDDGVAYVLRRRDSVCDSAKKFDFHAVEKCTVAAPSVIEACRADLDSWLETYGGPDTPAPPLYDTPPCSDFDDWLEGCAPTTEATCS